MMTPPLSIWAKPALTVKSGPFELEVPFCVVAALPWKAIASFKVMPVENDVYDARRKESKIK
jgi:hypothetical protein